MKGRKYDQKCLCCHLICSQFVSVISKLVRFAIVNRLGKHQRPDIMQNICYCHCKATFGYLGWEISVAEIEIPSSRVPKCGASSKRFLSIITFNFTWQQNNVSFSFSFLQALQFVILGWWNIPATKTERENAFIFAKECDPNQSSRVRYNRPCPRPRNDIGKL